MLFFWEFVSCGKVENWLCNIRFVRNVSYLLFPQRFHFITPHRPQGYECFALLQRRLSAGSRIEIFT